MSVIVLQVLDDISLKELYHVSVNCLVFQEFCQHFRGFDEVGKLVPQSTGGKHGGGGTYIL